MVKYRVMLSEYFPIDHPNAGKQTKFISSFNSAIMCARCKQTKKGMCMGECVTGFRKIHTIRCNYQLWEKRFQKINDGKAVISVCVWEGKPYGKNSIIKEIRQLSKEDGIGLQKLKIMDYADNKRGHIIDGISLPSLRVLANNDGLSLEDWRAWFRKKILPETYAIIHFTNFRY